MKSCLDSVLKQTFSDFEIIFVDNNSADDSVKFVEENYNKPKIKIVRSEKNLGFAGGNNLGYRHCSGEYTVLLNNDTTVEENWLAELINCIRSDESIGGVQSLVLTEGVPLRYYRKNGTINLLGHNIMEVFDIAENGIGEIFQLNGCSMIIQKKTVEEFGGLFPEEYFAYSEDTYLSFRLKFKGMRLLHNANSIVHHKGGGTSGNQRKSSLYFYQERNRLLNFIIFFPGIFQLKYFPYLTFNFFLKLFASIVSQKYSARQLIKVYRWLISNRNKINEMRLKVEKTKKVSGNEVLNSISGKLFNGDNFIEDFINTVSILYCRIANIKILETQTR